MSDYETYTCVTCGDAFKAYPDANAAQRETCSPRCDTDCSRL